MRDTYRQYCKDAESQRERRIKEHQSQPELASIAGALEGIGNEYRRENRETTKHQDRNFWVQVAGVAVVVIYAGVTARQACIMNDTLKEIQKQTPKFTESADAAKNAADSASASIRPWIKITDVGFRQGIGSIKTLMFHWPVDTPRLPGVPFPGTTTKPNLQDKIIIVNIGHSVAEDLQVFQDLYASKFDPVSWHSDVLREEKRFSAWALHSNPKDASMILFPSDSWEQDGTITTADVLGEGYAMALLVCVNYRDTSTATHQTQSWFGLYENSRILIDPKMDADASVLRLIREPSGDQAN